MMENDHGHDSGEIGDETEEKKMDTTLLQDESENEDLEVVDPYSDYSESGEFLSPPKHAGWALVRKHSGRCCLCFWFGCYVCCTCVVCLVLTSLVIYSLVLLVLYLVCTTSNESSNTIIYINETVSSLSFNNYGSFLVHPSDHYMVKLHYHGKKSRMPPYHISHSESSFSLTQKKGTLRSFMGIICEGINIELHIPSHLNPSLHTTTRLYGHTFNVSHVSLSETSLSISRGHVTIDSLTISPSSSSLLLDFEYVPYRKSKKKGQITNVQISKLSIKLRNSNVEFSKLNVSEGKLELQKPEHGSVEISSSIFSESQVSMWQMNGLDLKFHKCQIEKIPVSENNDIFDLGTSKRGSIVFDEVKVESGTKFGKVKFDASDTNVKILDVELLVIDGTMNRGKFEMSIESETYFGDENIAVPFDFEGTGREGVRMEDWTRGGGMVKYEKNSKEEKRGVMNPEGKRVENYVKNSVKVKKGDVDVKLY